MRTIQATEIIENLKNNNQELQEEGKVVGLKITKEDIHVMEKMIG